MPQKCSLTQPDNRRRIEQAFASAYASLKQLDTTVYHYACEGDRMRVGVTDLLRRIEALNARLKEKLSTGAEYLD